MNVTLLAGIPINSIGPDGTLPNKQIDSMLAGV